MIETIDFQKSNGLVPVVIQDDMTLQVLMLGYMNEEAFRKTESEMKVTFFSRTKNRLWTKGEESGNYLLVKSITLDCDRDTLLIMAEPIGPTCHKGNKTCWGEEETTNFNVLAKLENKINERWENESKESYVASLKKEGECG